MCFCSPWQKEKRSLLSLCSLATSDIAAASDDSSRRAADAGVLRRFLSVIPLRSPVGGRSGLSRRRQPGICEKRLLILVNKNSRRPISKPCLSRKASSAEIDMPPRRPQAFVRGGNKTTAVFGAVPSGKNQHEFFTGAGASPSDQTVPEKLPPFSPLGEGGKSPMRGADARSFFGVQNPPFSTKSP